MPRPFPRQFLFLAAALLGAAKPPAQADLISHYAFTLGPARLQAVPPPLPPGVQVTHPTGSPLRAALRPVPESAIFKMDGWYLWDPSVIRVGDTWHLFASRWPAADKMNGWFRSHVIRATSASLFGPYQSQVLCTDWESKATGIRKSVLHYTSVNGIDYDLVSQVPVWSQTDPVPLANGGSMRVAGIERPQVVLDDNGQPLALLVSAYPQVKESEPTFIILRPMVPPAAAGPRP